MYHRCDTSYNKQKFGNSGQKFMYDIHNTSYNGKHFLIERPKYGYYVYYTCSVS